MVGRHWHKADWGVFSFTGKREDLINQAHGLFVVYFGIQTLGSSLPGEVICELIG